MTLPVIEPAVRVIRELRAGDGNKLFGKLVQLPDGRRAIELACRGRDCPDRCLFDVETGDEVKLDFPGCDR